MKGIESIPKTKSTSFRLTEQALEQLAALAARFETSQASVLEFLIRDRFSQSDPQKNKKRMDKAWIEHCEWVAGVEKDNEAQKYLFTSGYRKGWRDFQRRHNEDKFIIEL